MSATAQASDATVKAVSFINDLCQMNRNDLCQMSYRPLTAKNRVRAPSGAPALRPQQTLRWHSQRFAVPLAGFGLAAHGLRRPSQESLATRGGRAPRGAGADRRTFMRAWLRHAETP